MKILVYVLIIFSLLSGCVSGPEQTDPTLESIEMTTESTPVTEATLPITEPTTEATELTEETINLNLLDIEAGSYLDQYVAPSGYYLDYYTFIPNQAEIDMPLIIFLHGDGEIGKINALQNIALIQNAKEIYGEDFPFIAIAPCRRQSSWCEQPAPSLLLALIEETVEKYQINRDKIIISGFSSGAMGTWYLITNHTDLFSAAVPISCPNEYPVLYHNLKNVPIWGFVGEKEDYYKRKMTEIIDRTVESGGDAKLTIIEGMAHKGMDTAAFTQEVIEWMIEQ